MSDNQIIVELIVNGADELKAQLTSAQKAGKELSKST